MYGIVHFVFLGLQVNISKSLCISVLEDCFFIIVNCACSDEILPRACLPESRMKMVNEQIIKRGTVTVKLLLYHPYQL